MMGASQNATQVEDVAVALAARLRALAENLERTDTVMAVSFVRETEKKGNQLYTSVEISLVEAVR